MPVRTCPVCGYTGEGFRSSGAGRVVCPRCGEASGGTPADAINVPRRTRAVGLALLLSGLLTFALSLGWMVAIVAVGPPLPQPVPGQDPVAARAARIGMRLGQLGPAAPGLLMSLVSIAGGIQLARRRMWGLAAAGAFLAALPCTCGFPIGLPVGVWALVVLSNPTVRNAFR